MHGVLNGPLYNRSTRSVAHQLSQNVLPGLAKLAQIKSGSGTPFIVSLSARCLSKAAESQYLAVNRGAVIDTIETIGTGESPIWNTRAIARMTALPGLVEQHPFLKGNSPESFGHSVSSLHEMPYGTSEASSS